MIAIHRAAPDQVPLLVELMREFHAESEYLLDTASASTAFSTLTSTDQLGAAWIAFRGVVAVGYVVITFRFSMEFGGIEGFIDDLYVRPNDRRRGCGGALLTELFAECGRREVHAVRVEVEHDNEAARALYRRFRMCESSRLVLTTESGHNPITKKAKKGSPTRRYRQPG